ncbi:PEP-CTERM sorting domain-containing protein [Pontiellaceae bacterium B1224]|nr:PEP-CTERM sorting domain-containing protein [Pontiellaceae bacterium B1224]
MIKNISKSVLGLIAILAASGVSAETITFHSDFDEADLGSTGLNIDTPSTSGAASGTVSLNTGNQQLDLTANAANMWTTREGAPIAWVAAPTVSVGETWFVETQVFMIDSEAGDQSGYDQGGITFYDGIAGSNPGSNAAPFLVLNDWNNWNINAQDFTIGGSGNNSVSPNLGTATGVFLRTEITEGGATDTYNSFYKVNEGDEWIQLTGWAENHTSDAPNSAVGLFVKSHGNNPDGAAQFDYLSVGVVPEPATFGLFAICGGGILFARRRFI